MSIRFTLLLCQELSDSTQYLSQSPRVVWSKDTWVQGTRLDCIRSCTPRRIARLSRPNHFVRSHNASYLRMVKVNCLKVLICRFTGIKVSCLVNLIKRDRPELTAQCHATGFERTFYQNSKGEFNSFCSES